MAGLEHLIANRTVLAGTLAFVGLVIAFGPEIRQAVTRLRSAQLDAPSDVEVVRAPVSAR